jgi:hypothetical protein
VSAERETAVHPSLDQLEAWADRRLDAAATATVERHFARCVECRQLAEDLRGFGDPVGQAIETEAETEASLGRLRMRILAEELAAGEGELGVGGRDGAAILPFERPAPPAAIPDRQRSPLLAWAAAALIAAGFSLAWERQREVDRLLRDLQATQNAAAAARRQPLVNTAMVTALPEDDPLRGGEEDKSGGDRGGTMVTVEGEDDLPLPNGPWRALIEDREGKKLLELDNLETVSGELRLTFLPGALPPGQYRLRLFLGGVAWQPVYSISLSDG